MTDDELKQKLFEGFPTQTDKCKTFIKELERSKDIQFEFNSIKPSMRKERADIIKRLFGSVGKNVLIESPFSCDLGYNISVGDNFYANHGCVILDCARVTIGDNVFLAPQVGIYAAGHPIDYKARNEGYNIAKPVTIGDNVWIGGGVRIIGGVTIGSGSVIGAGSVVISDIPENVVAVGNPCRVVRKIDKRDQIDPEDLVSFSQTE